MATTKPEPMTFKTELQRLWFFHFTNVNNPATFMNRAASAEAAGYKCKSYRRYQIQGSVVFRQVAPMIDQWLEEEGLSERALKLKLVKLLDAKETTLVKVKGSAINKADQVKTLLETSQRKIAADGSSYHEEHTVVAVDMDALEVQRKSLEMALKVKGMLKEQFNFTGLEGLADRIVEGRKRAGMKE